MLPTLHLLTGITPELSAEVTENNGFFDPSAELGPSFRALLAKPAEAELTLPAPFAALTGERGPESGDTTLPLPGNPLPLVTTVVDEQSGSETTPAAASVPIPLPVLRESPVDEVDVGVAQVAGTAGEGAVLAAERNVNAPVAAQVQGLDRLQHDVQDTPRQLAQETTLRDDTARRAVDTPPQLAAVLRESRVRIDTEAPPAPVPTRGSENDPRSAETLRPAETIRAPDMPRPAPEIAPVQNAETLQRAVPVAELPVERMVPERAEPASRAPIEIAASAALPAVDAAAPRDVQSAAARTIASTAIALPVDDPSWGDALRDRVMWMTRGAVQNAQIRLHPAELGPIQVQVSVEDDAAQLLFTAQHAVTREAIEQALPRLREMLAENGLSLSNATVSDSGTRQREASDNATTGAADDRHPDAVTADEFDATSAGTERQRAPLGLIDTFA